MKKIASLLLVFAMSSIASETDSHKITHNEVINYKSLYVQSLAELERLESMKDNLENELSSLQEIGKEIDELKADINLTYPPRKELAESMPNVNYSNAYFKYYGLIYTSSQIDYNKRIIDYVYEDMLDQYNGALIYAKTQADIGDDILELDMYNNVTVNGERLVK